jgi:hypothetical protein
LFSLPYVRSLFNHLPNTKIAFIFHMLSKKEKKPSQQFQPTLYKTLGKLGNKSRIIIICKIAKWQEIKQLMMDSLRCKLF